MFEELLRIISRRQKELLLQEAKTDKSELDRNDMIGNNSGSEEGIVRNSCWFYGRDFPTKHGKNVHMRKCGEK